MARDVQPQAEKWQLESAASWEEMGSAGQRGDRRGSSPPSSMAAYRGG
uniref:Uncharacterized protein n=1 Tax=Arundo donax TaxID=35708 RepID=A0A0A8Z6W7_ARUDO